MASSGQYVLQLSQSLQMPQLKQRSACMAASAAPSEDSISSNDAIARSGGNDAPRFFSEGEK
jgi:hypothetical protein